MTSKATLSALLQRSDEATGRAQATAAEQGKAAREQAYGLKSATGGRTLGYHTPEAVRRAVANFNAFKLPEVIPYATRGRAAWQAFKEGGHVHEYLAEKWSADFTSVRQLEETGQLGLMKHARRVVGVSTPGFFLTVAQDVAPGNTLKRADMLRATTSKHQRIFARGEYFRITLSKNNLRAEQMTPHSPTEFKESTMKHISLVSGRVERGDDMIRSAVFVMDMADYVETESVSTCIFTFPAGSQPTPEWLQQLWTTIKDYGELVIGTSFDGMKLRVKLCTAWTLPAIEHFAESIGAIFSTPANPQKDAEYKAYRTNRLRQARDAQRADVVTTRKQLIQPSSNVQLVVEKVDGGKITAITYSELKGVLKASVRAINFARTHETVTCDVDDAMALDGAIIEDHVFTVLHKIGRPLDPALATTVAAAWTAMHNTEVATNAKAWGISSTAAAAVMEKQARSKTWADVARDDGAAASVPPGGSAQEGPHRPGGGGHV
jgi:hypothetical protein